MSNTSFSALIATLLKEENHIVPVEQLRSIYTHIKGNELAKSPRNWRKALDYVWTELEHDAPTWYTHIEETRLPLVTRLNQFGWVRIVEKRHDGSWLIQDATGTEHVLSSLKAPFYAKLPKIKRATNVTTGKARNMFESAFAKHRGYFFEGVVATILINLIAFGASLYSMQVYDRVIPTQAFSTLQMLFVGVCIATIVELVIKLARSRLNELIMEGMDLELSRKVMQRLLLVRLDQLPSQVGSLSSQLRGYETVRGFVASAAMYVLVDAPFAIVFVLAIWLIGGPYLALVPTVFFFLSLIAGLAYRYKIKTLALESAMASNRKTGMLVDSVEGAETIKASGGSWRVLSNWVETSEEAMRNDMKTRHLSEQSSYITATLSQLSYILMITVGAYEVSENLVTQGGLIACSIISGRAMTPVAMLPSLLGQWAHASAALDGIEKIYQLETDNHGVAQPLIPDQIRGDIYLESVEFSYPQRPPAVALDRLAIKPGEKVAILGTVGAGKSTLLKLCAGLYKPSKGRLLLDGLDISQIDRAVLSQQIGYLPQQSRLFSGTLRANLIIGIKATGDKELLEAAKETGLIALISQHPQGLDMPIAEGGEGLSGGQKQLVALTRLMLNRPSIWMLDEPTSSLDEGLERHVIQMLSKEVGKTDTLLLVTHKPALLRLVDRVIILTTQGIAMDGPRDKVLQQLAAQSDPKQAKKAAIT